MPVRRRKRGWPRCRWGRENVAVGGVYGRTQRVEPTTNIHGTKRPLGFKYEVQNRDTSERRIGNVALATSRGHGAQCLAAGFSRRIGITQHPCPQNAPEEGSRMQKQKSLVGRIRGYVLDQVVKQGHAPPDEFKFKFKFKFGGRDRGYLRCNAFPSTMPNH